MTFSFVRQDPRLCVNGNPVTGSNLTLYPKFKTLKNVERNYTCTSLPYDISYARDIWFVLCRSLELLETFSENSFCQQKRIIILAHITHPKEWVFILKWRIRIEFIFYKKNQGKCATYAKRHFSLIYLITAQRIYSSFNLIIFLIMST